MAFQSAFVREDAGSPQSDLRRNRAVAFDLMPVRRSSARPLLLLINRAGQEVFLTARVR